MAIPVASDRKMVAMTEFSFPKQAALKAVDQREDLSMSHFCSKEKRPPVVDPMGVVYVHFQSSRESSRNQELRRYPICIQQVAKAPILGRRASQLIRAQL